MLMIERALILEEVCRIFLVASIDFNVTVTSASSPS